MFLPTSTVGRKIIMAITGQILVFFIVFHISGNSSIFFHTLNAYVVFLHSLPVVIWGGRLFLLAAFGLHLWYGAVLKLENYEAKPQPYAVTHYYQATFAGRNQIWTGVIIAAFLVYHLLHFTLQVTNPIYRGSLQQGRPRQTGYAHDGGQKFSEYRNFRNLPAVSCRPWTASAPRHPEFIPVLGTHKRPNAAGH